MNCCEPGGAVETHDDTSSTWWCFQEVDTSVLGLSAEDAKSKPYIASMGIYVFKKEILQKLLRYLISRTLRLERENIVRCMLLARAVEVMCTN